MSRRHRRRTSCRASRTAGSVGSTLDASRCPVAHWSRRLTAFAVRHRKDEFDVDVDDVIRRLGGRAETLFDMFAAVAASMAPAGEVIGEKTPEHLSWWRPLLTALPELKLIGVVRDARAVVSRPTSWCRSGCGGRSSSAERWAADQADLAEAQRVLGPMRCLVVRYEDVVAAPDDARLRLAMFLGRAPRVDGSARAVPTCTARGLEGPCRRAHRSRPCTRPGRPSSMARRRRWSAAICQTGLAHFGYPVGEGLPSDRRPRRSPMALLRRHRFHRQRRERAARIAAFNVKDTRMARPAGVWGRGTSRRGRLGASGASTEQLRGTERAQRASDEDFVTVRQPPGRTPG